MRQELFDYKSKYLPGLSRKITPIDLADKNIERIREACSHLYKFFRFNVYARIDGFYTENGEIFLNDPNTTSGMLPSSFFFHQAAEIGLNPSQFLSYVIRISLQERIAGREDELDRTSSLIIASARAIRAKILTDDPDILAYGKKKRVMVLPNAA